MKNQSAFAAWFPLRLLLFLAFTSGGTLSAERNIFTTALLNGSTMAASQENTYSDESIISSTRSVLKFMNVDVLKIEIVIDRSNGGKRVMIINCAHCGGSEDDHLRELVKIMQSGDAVNKSFQARIDVVTTVVGNRQGRVCAVISVKSSDAEQYVQTKDVYAYLNKWTVAIFEPDFLPQTASVLNW
ncbi:hypothetical protein ACFL5M_01500 [Candidatus Neomarinimicrobiota bacterium]